MFMMSKFFIDQIYTACYTIISLANFICGSGRGMSAIISSDFSKLIMSKDIPKTKRYAWLSTTIVLVFTFSLFCIFYAKRVLIAEIMINDKNIHQCIQEMLLAYLAYMFSSVSMYTIYGIVRGLGKEKIFIPLIILFYIISIFVMLFLILIGVGENLILYGLLFGEVCGTIAGILIIGLADWRKEADVIVNNSE